jgi:glycine/D-amino acid oxidase-like deaminating enzyme
MSEGITTNVPDQQPEFITYSTTPSGNHKGKTHYIIVGAGIIGVCIAFYLTRHPKFDREKHYITILESKRVAGGASGKAGGLLALWAFPQQIVPLSFQLHQDLSNEFNGEDEWGYRRLTTISVEGDISDSRLKYINEITQRLNNKDNNKDKDSNNTNNSTKLDSIDEKFSISEMKREKGGIPNNNNNNNNNNNSPDLGSKPMSRATTIKKNSIEIESNNSNSNNKLSSHLPKNLGWINDKVINDWNQLGNESTTAQVHPYQFTTFILNQCISTGCVELVIGKIDDIIINDETGECNGIIYHPSSAKAENDGTTNQKFELFGDKVIMSIGPWTSKILPDCPISGLRAHSIIIQPENVEEISPYAVFTELKLNKNKFVSPEIYARKDEVYVCGEGDSSVLIPETTDDVEVVTEKCEELFKYVSKLSNNLKNGKVLKRQACYLPVLDIPSSSGPLIGETNVDNLYLASGHSCWGINNAPATGLLMSELILDGEATSCDISALNPSLYFDASLIYDEEDNDELDEYDEEDDEEDEDEDDEDDDDDDDERRNNEGEDSYDEEDDE